jgi:hypothetical protein
VPGLNVQSRELRRAGLLGAGAEGGNGEEQTAEDGEAHKYSP